MKDLRSEATSKYLIHESDTQCVYQFPNHRGASVIRSPYSYGGPAGLFELGVAHFFGDGDQGWRLDYSTEICDDVLGHLTAQEVEIALLRIKNLPDPEPGHDTKYPQWQSNQWAAIALGDLDEH